METEQDNDGAVRFGCLSSSNSGQGLREFYEVLIISLQLNIHLFNYRCQCYGHLKTGKKLI